MGVTAAHLSNYKTTFVLLRQEVVLLLFVMVVKRESPKCLSANTKRGRPEKIKVPILFPGKMGFIWLLYSSTVLNKEGKV